MELPNCWVPILCTVVEKKCNYVSDLLVHITFFSSSAPWSAAVLAFHLNIPPYWSPLSSTRAIPVKGNCWFVGLHISTLLLYLWIQHAKIPLKLHEAVLEHTNYRRGGSGHCNLKFITVSLTSMVQFLALWLVYKSSRIQISDGTQAIPMETFVNCRHVCLMEVTTGSVVSACPSLLLNRCYSSRKDWREITSFELLLKIYRQLFISLISARNNWIVK